MLKNNRKCKQVFREVNHESLVAGLSILMILLFYLPAHAGAPLNTVQANVNKCLMCCVIQSSKLSQPKEIKKAKLRLIYDEMFEKWNSPGVP